MSCWWTSPDSLSEVSNNAAVRTFREFRDERAITDSLMPSNVLAVVIK